MIKNKMAASMLLLVILGTVLLNNINRNNHSEELSKHINSIYDDRLVAENYILKLSGDMHQIISLTTETDIDDNAKRAKLGPFLLDIKKLNSEYGNTWLTNEERKAYEQYIVLCNQLYIHAANNEFESCKNLATKSISTLDMLAAIQLSEAKSIMAKTDRLFSSAESSSQLEIAILIIIGLLIQALIFSSIKQSNYITTSRHHLN
jgi:hypothetical protein